ncbi:hypothetical protein EJF36_06285 [Bacillus sp. HMF5848]|uniref:UPF0738 family protein n=1 Tax=Bacillus sp. HMF5848 TaxID=2495421 RepID=UPI000F774526|nr:hypothetical protein [Bacillus sp. HMF5848]RSK26498.1 hypothetical protein EJF36_06285 [Bacillus sp. HMF5848]
MRTILQVSKTLLQEKQFFFITEETMPLNIQANGQMLVDSDNLAFIYLLENDESYIYASIKEDFWHDISNACKMDVTFILKSAQSETEIELVNFKEEMTYLISNIEGNSNYGEEMVTKVMNAFSDMAV